MGATLILVVFWLVYCTSPELQAAVNFFNFPLAFAPYALAIIKRQRAS